MAPTAAPASTFTYTGPGYTHIDTYPDHNYTNYNLSDDPTTVVSHNERTATPTWVIVVAVIFSLLGLALIAGIIFCVHHRRKRKLLDFYGLPPPSPLPAAVGDPAYNPGMYSEVPNAYSQVPQSIYNATRNVQSPYDLPPGYGWSPVRRE